MRRVLSVTRCDRCVTLPCVRPPRQCLQASEAASRSRRGSRAPRIDSTSYDRVDQLLSASGGVSRVEAHWTAWRCQV